MSSNRQPMDKRHRIAHFVSFLILMCISIPLVVISYKQQDWNKNTLTLNAVLSGACGVKLNFSNSVLLNGIPLLPLALVGIFFSYRGQSTAVNSVYIAFFIFNIPSIIMTVANQKDSKIYPWAYLDAINQTLSGHSLDGTLQELQEQYECCGWWGPSDYNSTQVMASCCALDPKQLTPSATCNITSIVYHRGCRKAIHFYLLPHYLQISLALVITVSVLAFVQPIVLEFVMLFIISRTS